MIPFVDIHTHSDDTSSNEVLSHITISAKSDEIFSFNGSFWCGLHPAEEMDCEELINRLERVKDKIIGIGEIGLDRIYGTVNQADIFRLQLDFASRNNFPITIHCVRMYNEIIKILHDFNNRKIVIHSFVGSKEVAKELLDLGCCISFGATSLKSPRSIDALKLIPQDRLFIESDGKGYIKDYYNSISEILNIDIEVLKEIIYKNYLWLIG